MVNLYSTGCPQCKVLTKKLDEKGIIYNIIIDVDTMIKRGFTSVPVLEVEDKVYNFSQAIQWVKEQ